MSGAGNGTGDTSKDNAKQDLQQILTHMLVEAQKRVTHAQKKGHTLSSKISLDPISMQNILSLVITQMLPGVVAGVVDNNIWDYLDVHYKNSQEQSTNQAAPDLTPISLLSNTAGKSEIPLTSAQLLLAFTLMEKAIPKVIARLTTKAENETITSGAQRLLTAPVIKEYGEILTEIVEYQLQQICLHNKKSLRLEFNSDEDIYLDLSNNFFEYMAPDSSEEKMAEQKENFKGLNFVIPKSDGISITIDKPSADNKSQAPQATLPAVFKMREQIRHDLDSLTADNKIKAFLTSTMVDTQGNSKYLFDELEDLAKADTLLSVLSCASSTWDHAGSTNQVMEVELFITLGADNMQQAADYYTYRLLQMRLQLIKHRQELKSSRPSPQSSRSASPTHSSDSDLSSSSTSSNVTEQQSSNRAQGFNPMKIIKSIAKLHEQHMNIAVQQVTSVHKKIIENIETATNKLVDSAEEDLSILPEIDKFILNAIPVANVRNLMLEMPAYNLLETIEEAEISNADLYSILIRNYNDLANYIDELRAEEIANHTYDNTKIDSLTKMIAEINVELQIFNPEKLAEQYKASKIKNVNEHINKQLKQVVINRFKQRSYKQAVELLTDSAVMQIFKHMPLEILETMTAEAKSQKNQQFHDRYMQGFATQHSINAQHSTEYNLKTGSPMYLVRCFPEEAHKLLLDSGPLTEAEKRQLLILTLLAEQSLAFSPELHAKFGSPDLYSCLYQMLKNWTISVQQHHESDISIPSIHTRLNSINALLDIGERDNFNLRSANIYRFFLDNPGGISDELWDNLLQEVVAHQAATQHHTQGIHTGAKHNQPQSKLAMLSKQSMPANIIDPINLWAQRLNNGAPTSWYVYSAADEQYYNRMSPIAQGADYKPYVAPADYYISNIIQLFAQQALNDDLDDQQKDIFSAAAFQLWKYSKANGICEQAPNPHLIHCDACFASMQKLKLTTQWDQQDLQAVLLTACRDLPIEFQENIQFWLKQINKDIIKQSKTAAQQGGSSTAPNRNDVFHATIQQFTAIERAMGANISQQKQAAAHAAQQEAELANLKSQFKTEVLDKMQQVPKQIDTIFAGLQSNQLGYSGYFLPSLYAAEIKQLTDLKSELLDTLANWEKTVFNYELELLQHNDDWQSAPVAGKKKILSATLDQLETKLRSAVEELSNKNTKPGTNAALDKVTIDAIVKLYSDNWQKMRPAAAMQMRK